MDILVRLPMSHDSLCLLVRFVVGPQSNLAAPLVRMILFNVLLQAAQPYLLQQPAKEC